jgi:hypothetical protein
MADKLLNDIRAPSARVAVTERARTQIEPPEALSKAQRKKWDVIVAARSVKEWGVGIDLYLALMLCKMMVQLDREERLLYVEGSVVNGPRGGKVPNPRAPLVASLRSFILRYEARLHFDTEIGNSTDRKNARQAERNAVQRDNMHADDSDLIQRLDTGRDPSLLPHSKPRPIN